MRFTYNFDNEKNIQDKLGQDAEIPAVVHEKVTKAYRMIENRTVVPKQAPRDPWRWMKTGGKIAGGLAACLAAAFVFCVANPVMARELPLIGGIFEQLQDKVSFFGDFADKATVLEEPSGVSGNTDSEEASEQSSSEASGEDGADASGMAYTKTSGDLTVSFSEIYANDQAIYLTMSMKTEDTFPETMVGLDGKPIMGLEASTAFDFKESDSPDGNIQYYNLEGAFLDDHTYSCILRIDLAEAAKDFSEYNEQYDLMTQQVLDEMGVTQDDLDDETEEGYALLTEFVNTVSERGGALQSYIKTIEIPDSFLLTLDISKVEGSRPQDEIDPNASAEEYYELSTYTFEGGWSFEIPVTIDTTQTETLEINETNENGIGLKSIVRTPYELTVYELYEEGADSDSFLVALDADGNKLPYNDSNGNTNNFAIQDRDISTVDIYILDYVQYMDELKGEDNYNNNETKPEGEKWSDLLDQHAKYHTTVHFEQ